MKWRIKNGFSRNARVEPTTASRDVGTLRAGTVLELKGWVNSQDPVFVGRWANVQRATLAGNENELENIYVWDGDALEDIEQAPPPPPPPPPAETGRPPILVGFNSLRNHHIAKRAYDLGCRAFTICDDFLFATSLASDQTAFIAARRVAFVATNPVDAAQQLEGMSDPNIRYTTLNEQDNGIQGSGAEEVRNRFAYDMSIANEARSRGVRYIGGGYAMGNPDITNPDVRAAFADTYAKAYNDGVMGFHYHAYAGKPGEIEFNQGHEWLSTRAGFLFTDCGFDIHGKGELVYTEEGLDEMGVGGYPAHGYTPDMVVLHMLRKVELHKSTWVSPISGKTIPYIPVRAMTLFQIGDNHDGSGGWAGYNCEPYINAMAAAGLFNPL